MNIAEQFFLAIALLFVVLIAFKLFSTPLRLVLKVGMNTVLGFLALIALGPVQPAFGSAHRRQSDQCPDRWYSRSAGPGTFGADAVGVSCLIAYIFYAARKTGGFPASPLNPACVPRDPLIKAIGQLQEAVRFLQIPLFPFLRKNAIIGALSVQISLLLFCQRHLDRYI